MLELFTAILSLSLIPFAMFIIKDLPEAYLNVFTFMSIVDVFVIGLGIVYLEIYSEVLRNKGKEKVEKWNIKFFDSDLFINKYIYEHSAYMLIPFYNIKVLMNSLKYVRGSRKKDFMTDWYLNQFALFVKEKDSIIIKHQRSTLLKEALYDSIDDSSKTENMLNIANKYYKLLDIIKDIDKQSRRDLENRNSLESIKIKAIGEFLEYIEKELEEPINNIKKDSMKIINDAQYII